MRIINLMPALAFALTLAAAAPTMNAQAASVAPASAVPATTKPVRPKGPCDIYAAAGDPCVAAHSTTRALYASYDGPLYRIERQSDGKSLDIGVVKSSLSDAGGYADAAAQDAFCANSYCWIATIYDQARKHNDLTQAPRGSFSGPALGGFNNLPMADMAPITIMGHKAYGVFIAPGMGLRQNDAKGTAVDDQAEGQYWVINGLHFNSGCCFDYGNAEIDSRDDGNGTMETTYYGDSATWYHGTLPGPWVMTDQENNLVGCVTPDGAKLCPGLPDIGWRFVTAMAKGEPHHWTSLGGDARQGALSVMFSGPRINATYDPMRKQGAILLGNGGDNSNSSQGTFYEGAMTAAGTFPTDATDQLVQANIVAAGYDVPRLILAPASAIATPPGLQSFAPGSSQDTSLIFINTTGAAVSGLRLSLSLPKQWSGETSRTFAGPIAPGASVSATFRVTSGPTAFNGDLVGVAAWINSAGDKHTEKTVEKLRNASPVKINELRISDGSSANATNSFIELYNAGPRVLDISNWTLTEHPTQKPVFSSVVIPAGAKLAARGFYLLGLSNSGLATPVRGGDAALSVRSIAGMTAGDTISIDTGAHAETRTIASIGTAATEDTALWQPVTGALITLAPGATNVPVASTAGFVVGEKIAIGHGATYPAVARGVEHYEIATVTAVGQPGTQAFLGTDAAAGATNIKVTAVANISAGDQIRLDIDSLGHGIETVTIKTVGTPASRTALVADADSGATRVKTRGVAGLAVGQKIIIGTPVSRQTVTITAVDSAMPGLQFMPALSVAHVSGEDVVAPGTGLDLAAPLKFSHAANLPFGDRGTGVSFMPATKFPHSSNEPVQALGTGITLDKPLIKSHAINAVVQDAAATLSGYVGAPAPDLWFGGPALSASAGNMVLRDKSGLVVDSINYGLLVDPWASSGYQAVSGFGLSGCKVAAPGSTGGTRPPFLIETNSSVGRVPDGADTGNSCTDFVTQAATTIPNGSPIGATNIKVVSVASFKVGQTVIIEAATNRETAVIAGIGTGGATVTTAASEPGATILAAISGVGFVPGEAITIGYGADLETATVVTAAGSRNAARIIITAPLKSAHPAGAMISGSGITLGASLAKAHAGGAQVITDLPTPGASNKYSSAR